MSFSQDLKDFVAAFQAGYRMIPSQTDEEYKKAQTELLKRKMASEDPELERQLKLAEIDKSKAYADYYRRPDAGVRTYRGANSPETLTPEQQQQIEQLQGGNPYGLDDPNVPEFADGGMFQMPQMSGIPMGGGFPMTGMFGRNPAFQQRFAQFQPKMDALREKLQGVWSRIPQLQGMPQFQMPQMGAVTQPSNQQGAIPMQGFAMPQGQMPKYGGQMPNMPQYAEGGLVDEQETVDNPEEDKAEGLPAGFSYAAAQDAVKGGYESLAEQFKQTGAVSVPNDRGKQAMESGMGAVDPKQLDEVDKAAGLENMPEDRKNMARLATVWEFYMKNGMPNRAKAAAGDLLQTYRMIHNRFSAIAQEAAQQGDVDGAVDAALRAYSYIPDGKTYKIKKRDDGRYVYSYTDDKTGKTVSKGILTPDEILGAVTQHGMNSFDDLVMASGNKDEIAKLKEDRAAERQVASEGRAEKRALAKETRDRFKDAGMSQDDPAEIFSQEDIDALPLGRYFKNPADGRVLRKLRAKPKAAAPVE